jgi:hypothetical protein
MSDNAHDFAPYYTVIAAPVRYDPQLTDFQIKLFGEIICRTNKEGYCLMANQDFVDIFNRFRNNDKPPLSKSTISKAISQLKENGHLTIDHKEQKDGSLTRVIYPKLY